MKEVFTTIEAAKICRVSQQTIIRCFDSGKLRGFRVPGSRFRRIPREELLRFLAEYDLPLSRIDILSAQSDDLAENPILPIASQDAVVGALPETRSGECERIQPGLAAGKDSSDEEAPPPSLL